MVLPQQAKRQEEEAQDTRSLLSGGRGAPATNQMGVLFSTKPKFQCETYTSQESLIFKNRHGK